MTLPPRSADAALTSSRSDTRTPGAAAWLASGQDLCSVRTRPAQPSACFFGSRKMGSWQIRARQMATMRTWWNSSYRLTADEILAHDIFCFVKRVHRMKMRLLRELGKVVVFDVLDCWRQPADGIRCDTRQKVRAWFEEFLHDLPVDGVVFPNRTMMEDLGDLVPNPTVLYHHFWPGLEPIEVRREAQCVGYEGEAHYLGPWRRAIERACARRGLQFVVNPQDFRSIDIGFAARGGEHGSLMAYRYKSNIKLANFYGAAVPCIVSVRDEAYRETACEGVRFFADEAELERALDELLPYEARLAAHRSLLQGRGQFTIDAIADEYAVYFTRLAGERMDADASAGVGVVAGANADADRSPAAAGGAQSTFSLLGVGRGVDLEPAPDPHLGANERAGCDEPRAR